MTSNTRVRIQTLASQIMVLQLTDFTSEITDEELREFTSEYYIPFALHPVMIADVLPGTSHSIPESHIARGMSVNHPSDAGSWVGDIRALPDLTPLLVWGAPVKNGDRDHVGKVYATGRAQVELVLDRQPESNRRNKALVLQRISDMLSGAKKCQKATSDIPLAGAQHAAHESILWRSLIYVNTTASPRAGGRAADKSKVDLVKRGPELYKKDEEILLAEDTVGRCSRLRRSLRVLNSAPEASRAKKWHHLPSSAKSATIHSPRIQLITRQVEFTGP
ncbi:hypothetical protein Tco_0250634 [Tanacetum coccineum]